MYPYLFIVGCPRWAPRPLRRIIDAHPQIAITRRDALDRQAIREATGSDARRPGYPGAALLAALRREVHPHGDRSGHSKGWWRNRAIRSPTRPSSPVSLISTERDTASASVGDKVPVTCAACVPCTPLWPEAKFVHLIRDGRDVCMSAMKLEKAGRISLARRSSTWTEDPVTTAGVWWEWHVRLGRQDGTSLAPNLYHEVRYEALVSRARRDVRGAVLLLGPTLRRRYAQIPRGARRRRTLASTRRRAWRPLTPGLRKWSEQMPAEDLECFEAAAGELLEDSATLEPARTPQMRRWLGQHRSVSPLRGEVSASGKRLPKGWQA